MFALVDPSKWSRWYQVARHPPRYLTASIMVSIGGILNGFDSSTIGPVIVMPLFTQDFGELSPSLAGIVVSSVLLPGAFASFFAGAMSDRLGRTRAVAIGALIFAIGAGLEAAAVNLGMFVGGRCIVGIGQGLFLSTVLVYICEIAPPNQRGPLASFVQLCITLGLCVGFFTCYGSVTIPSSFSWRLPLALQSGLAFTLCLASFFYLPQSPRWLAYKGRKEEASLAWDKLGVSGAEREKNLLQDPAPTDDIGRQADSTEPKILTFREKVRRSMEDLTAVFRGNARKPMLLGVFLMSVQQLSGIDGIIYYAPLLFQQAGLGSSEAKFLASGVSAICIFAFTILAVIFVDRWGRRPSTIYGGLVLFACMSTMGLLYSTKNVHPTSGIGRWIVIVMIYIFAIVYSMTWAMGVKLLASEIQPVATRATAQSLAQSANFVANFFVAFITPILLAQSSSAIYFLFGGVLALGIGVSTIYMPETRGRDLETIGEAFGAQSARDMPFLSSIKRLSGRTAKSLGLTHARGVDVASRQEQEGVELQARS